MYATHAIALVFQLIVISASYDPKQVCSQFKSHEAFSRMEMQFCGSWSYSQTTRGPLRCDKQPNVGDHQWLVALGYENTEVEDDSTSPTISFKCSGVLVSNSVVLTSAICVENRPKVVRLLEYDLASKNDCHWHDKTFCLQPIDYEVTSSIQHPKFKRSNVDTHMYNLGLIYVKMLDPENVKKTALVNDLIDYVTPICLPMFAQRDNPTQLISVSYGLNTNKRLPTSNRKCCTCRRDPDHNEYIMREYRISELQPPSSANSRTQCVALNKTKANKTATTNCNYKLLRVISESETETSCIGTKNVSCLADFGSPLVSFDWTGTYYYVIGITSILPSYEQCNSAHPTYFTDVRPHIKWILDGIASFYI